MNNKNTSFKIKILVLTILFFAKGWGQVTIASDGLNNATSLFTLNGGKYFSGRSSNGDLPSNSPLYWEGNYGYGINNGTASLTSNSDINTSGYSSVTMSLRVAAFSIGSSGNGVEPDDIVTVEVSADGGTNWFSTVRVLGESNACWSFSGGKNASAAYDGNSSPVDFQPNSGGELTSDGYSTITIINLPSVLNLRFRITLLNDSPREQWLVDDFKVTGIVSCIPPVLSTTHPSSGPAGTEVVITASSGDLTGATANFGGVAATVIATSTTQMTIVVPPGATGNLTIKNSVGCQVLGAFTIRKEDKTSCGSGTGSFSDLIISEVYDSANFNVWHMELFNPTAAPIDLSASNYKFEIYQTKGDPSSLARTVTLSGIVLPGKVFLANLGDSGTPCPKAFDFTDSSQGINEDDQIRLTKNGVLVDVVNCPSTKGYTIERKPTAIGPKTVYSASDWTTLSSESCSDLGFFPYTPSAAPTIIIQPSFTPTCSNIVFSVTANEGVVGGNSLAYQWYFVAPNSTTWQPVTDGGVYNGATNSVLAISSYSGLLGYQYYCQVRENTATCSTASNAVKISSSGSSVVLNITNPAPVCGAPGIVDIMVPAITAGSIGSGSLSYWTDIAATIPLPNPSTVASSGTYYIKSVAGTCSDIKPVVVTINSALVLSISNPNPVCAPTSVDITAASVTAGSSGSGILSYWTDAAATIALPNPSTIATSGTYYIKSAAGTCSDIKAVLVTVNSSLVLKITSPAPVCAPASVDITASSVTAGSSGSGILSYWTDAAATIALPNPSTIATSGTYYIKSVAGTCSDIKAVIVTVNSLLVLKITSPAAVCSPATVDITAASVTAGSTGSGILSYWTDAAATIALPNPSTVGSSGTYYIKSVAGTCSDIKAVIVTVNSSLVLKITSPAPVCAPASVDITAASITAGSSGSGTLSYWTDAAATIALSNPSTITTSGTYYIKSVAGTCFDIKAVIVTVNSLLVLKINSPAAVCSPATVDVTGASITAGSTGSGILSYWTDAAATITLPNPSTVASSGTYYIKSVSGTCSDIKPVIIMINSSVALSITNPTPVCSPATVDVTAASITAGSSGSGILSYWTDAAATSALSNPSTITTSGTYYIKSVSGTCSDIKAVIVTVNSSLVLKITPPAAVCSPATVDVTAVSVTAGSMGSGVLSYWMDANATIALINPSTVAISGTYYIKSTSGTCSDIKPVTVVIINTQPINSVQYLCFDQAGQVIAPITIDTNLSASDYSFVWTLAGNTLAITTSSYQTSTLGLYSIIATSLTGGCKIVFNADVKESKEAIAVATVGNDFDNQQQIIVTVTGGLGNYEYQLDDGFIQSVPIFLVSKAGDYVVKVIDKLGCNNFLLPVNVLNYPRFFTPNTDGYNDTWNIEGLNKPEKAIIYIFDRYGKLLKQISPIGRGWDGIYNGVALPASDYWFRLLYQDSIGASKEFKAHFSLKR